MHRGALVTLRHYLHAGTHTCTLQTQEYGTRDINAYKQVMCSAQPYLRILPS